MSSPNIIDFQAARMRALQKVTTRTLDCQLSKLVDLSRLPLVEDDAALVIRLVLLISRQQGRDYRTLPHLLRVALDDLCCDGNAACRLVRSWLWGEALVDQPPAELEAPRKFGNRIFRHGQFWRPGSPWLMKADEQRRERLISLLLELEGNE
jgi:hypothetical protein